MTLWIPALLIVDLGKAGLKLVGKRYRCRAWRSSLSRCGSGNIKGVES